MPLTFEQAVDLQSYYTSSDRDTIEGIANVRMMGFVGASTVGKNANMDLTGGHPVGTRTTRDLREGEEGVTSYEMGPVLRLIELGIPVQYAAIGELGDIYFTLESDYKPGLNVKDVDRKVVDSLGKVGFEAFLPVGVVAPANEFERRFISRFGDLSREKILGRLAHAADTTELIVEEWCTDESKLVLVSTPRLNIENKIRMNSFYREGRVDPADNLGALTVGRQMLTMIKHLEKHFSA